MRVTKKMQQQQHLQQLKIATKNLKMEQNIPQKQYLLQQQLKTPKRYRFILFFCIFLFKKYFFLGKTKKYKRRR